MTAAIFDALLDALNERGPVTLGRFQRFGAGRRQYASMTIDRIRLLGTGATREAALIALQEQVDQLDADSDIVPDLEASLAFAQARKAASR